MPKYTVAGIGFERKEDVEAWISRILNDGSLGSRVDLTDEPFIRGMLALRADKLAEIGNRAVRHFVRDVQPPPFQRTRSIWAILEDGEKLDVSLYKAVRVLKPGVDPLPPSRLAA